MKVNKDIFWHTFGKFQGSGFCSRCNKKLWDHYLVNRFEKRNRTQTIAFCKSDKFKEFRETVANRPGVVSFDIN